MLISWTQVIVLSLLQGVTEFLPISSSAHLIILPKIVNWPDQGLAFDVVVHIGTLLAVCLYFKDKIIKMAKQFMKPHDQDGHIAWLVVFATIPVGLGGLFIKFFLGENYLRHIPLIAWATIGFGLILGLVWSLCRDKQSENQLSYKKALLIGFAQMCALIPGASRSGVTIIAGLIVGLSPKASARFSFLLSIPVILLAGLLESYQLVQVNIINMAALPKLLVAALVSFISAFSCIKIFITWVNRIGLWPFAIYRLILGCGLFLFIAL